MRNYCAYHVDIMMVALVLSLEIVLVDGLYHEFECNYKNINVHRRSFGNALYTYSFTHLVYSSHAHQELFVLCFLVFPVN